MKRIPKRLLASRYRREMWYNSNKIMKNLDKILPVSSACVLGSFATKKQGQPMLIS
jgi:hypothetical protein